MFRNVVLPEPEGPVTETNSPSSTLSENSLSACVSTVSVRYTLDTLFILNMAVFSVCLRVSRTCQP